MREGRFLDFPYSGPSHIFYSLPSVFLFVTWSTPHNSSVKSLVGRGFLWCSLGRQGTQDARVVAETYGQSYFHLFDGASGLSDVTEFCLYVWLLIWGLTNTWGWSLIYPGHLSPHPHFVKYKWGGSLAERSFHILRALKPTFPAMQADAIIAASRNTGLEDQLTWGAPTPPLLLCCLSPSSRLSLQARQQGW